MIKFILLLLIIFFAIVILTVGFLSKFVRLFFKKPEGMRGNQFGGNNRQSNQTEDYENSSGHHKVFGKDEGEYIDYEEIK